MALGLDFVRGAQPVVVRFFTLAISGRSVPVSRARPVQISGCHLKPRLSGSGFALIAGDFAATASNTGLIADPAEKRKINIRLFDHPDIPVFRFSTLAPTASPRS